jgi:autotransporter-associated beta strand protein
LALTNGSAIADTAVVTNSGATLRVDSSETIGSLRGSGSTVLNGAAVTLTVAETNSQTYAGVISGAGGLTKSGTGTVTLSASNTHTGGTTINAGTVAISNGSAFGSNTVTFGSNGTTVAALASVQVNNNYALTGNGTMDVGANILTNSGVISGAGSLTKAGAGTMVLGAANTYSGGTTINAGTVAISNGSSFGSNTVTFASNGTTVAALASVQVTNNYALTGNGTMDVGANILTNSGVISGAGSLTKAGAGTLTLGASNSYAGGTTINAGALSIGAGGSILGNVTNAASLVFDPTGSLVSLFSGNITNTSSNSIISVVSGTLQAGNGSVSNTIFGYAGTGGTNGATGSSGGQFGGSGGTGGSGINGGTALTLTNGANLFNNIASLVTGGAGGTGGGGGPGGYGFKKGGPGGAGGAGGAGGVAVSITLAGNLTNSGTITGGNGAAGGRGGDGGFPASDGGRGGDGGAGGVAVSFASAGTLTNSGTITGGNGGAGGSGGTAGSFTGAGGAAGAAGAGGVGVTFDGSGSLVNSGTISGGTNGNGSGLALGASFSGNSNALVNLGSGVINGGVSMTGSNNSVTLFTGSLINGALNMGADTQSLLTLDGAGTSLLSSTTFAGQLTKQGAGTWTLDSTLNASSLTISGGTLRLANENAAGTGSVIQTTMASLVEFLGGGRMTNQMTAFQYSFANSFEAAGQVTLADTASSIAVSSGATVTGSGSFIGTGGLTKKGLGTLSLTAGNSFSGPLSVEAGTLALAASGSSAAGSVTSVSVSSGATLLISQSNQVNNNATVTLSGGTITRGSGVSEVFGTLNLTQSSFLDFGSGATGTITFGTYAPSALLTVQNFLPGNKLQFGNTISSTDLNNTSLFQFSNGFTTGTESGFFTITAIPEPSTYIAALGLLALMLWPLRRRLRGKA